MKRPKICAVIVNEDLAAIRAVEPLVDLFEVRVDLIGEGWPEVVRQLKKPWIGCNRSPVEGGGWKGSEADRIEQLLKTVDLGAEIIDLELATNNLGEIVPLIKKKAKCLLSYHNLSGTPVLETLKGKVKQQLEAGADIGKVVTTARSFADNLSVLQLIKEFPQSRIVALAMGDAGALSRILCPLVGGDFTYAAITRGLESASGQTTVKELRHLYKILSR